MSYRLKWAVRQFGRDKSTLHNNVLRSPWKYQAALLAKLVPWIFPFPITLKLKEGGEFDVNHFMTLSIYKEIFIDRCYDIPDLASCNTIIDVGSNTGLFAIRMKQLFPDARLVCYEPFPPNFRELKSNIMASRFEKCELIMKGVSGNAGPAVLYLHPRNLGGHSLLKSEAGKKFTTVETESMNDILQKTSCDLLKLDCEGAEYDILMSMRKSRSNPRIIVFETTPKAYEVSNLLDHLTRIGYQVRRKNGSRLFLAFKLDRLR